MSSPSEDNNGDGDRDRVTGRFCAGNKVAAGRATRSDIQRLKEEMRSNHSALLSAASGKDIKAVVKGLLDLATGRAKGARPRDRVQASELLLRYLVGVPPKEELPEPVHQQPGWRFTLERIDVAAEPADEVPVRRVPNEARALIR